MLGCTVMGAPLMTLMASFPEVVARVERWGEELEKVRYLVSELEKIEGVRQVGMRPKQHTLTHMETEGFYRVSEGHKRKGFFLYDELRARKIMGIQAGLTKHFKFNTYGLTWDQVRYVRDAFFDIAKKYGLKVS
jgi:Sep-tRNA:Cys-tRNA synthetase